jgi:F-type H+-transporting ATPase subunit c
MADLVTITQALAAAMPAADAAVAAVQSTLPSIDVAETTRGSVAIGKGVAYGVAGGGAGIGIGLVVAATLNGMARQPEQAGKLQTLMFIGIAFIELVFLFGIVLTFILK